MALNAPFVMKLSYYLPSEENQKKNLAHINYIIRPGAVDYGAMEPENQASVETARQEMERDELIHLQYMHERPRSSGLFGENGDLDINETKDLLSNHEGIVWRCIVSLREDDAIRLDRIERSKWEESLTASFAEIQDKLGIPASNFRWAAAYHPEPGHPHCHLLFWEENPVRMKGTLSRGEVTDIKKAFVKNICTRDREQLLMEKEYYRDALRNGVRDLMGIKKNLEQDSADLQANLGGKPGIAPKLFPEQEQYLHDRLEQLSGIMPGHGRVAFDYMPETVKQEVGAIADWIIDQPDFVKAKDFYLQANLDIVNMYMRDQPKEIKQAMERAYNDLRKRVAQDILKAAVQYPGRHEPSHPELAHDSLQEETPFPTDVDAPYNEVNISCFADDIDSLIPDMSPKESEEEEKAEKEAAEWFRESFRLLERQNNISEYQSIPEVDYPKLGEELIKLRDLIPDDFDGRVVMAYLPEALRKDTREVADKLLDIPHTQYLQNLSNMNFIRDRIAENALSHAIRLQNKEIPNIKMILHSRRAIEITERLMTAKPDLILGNTEELEWTAAKMHEALSKMGVLPQREVEQFMVGWEQNIGLNVNAVNSLVNQNLKITDKRKMNFISKSDWSRLRDNLGFEEHELLIPWMGQIEKETQDPGKEKQELKNVVPQILDPDKVPDAIQFFKDATADSEFLENIKELKWTIWTSSWVLEQFGLTEQERFNIISDWAERSGVNISRARIADIIDRPTLNKNKLDGYGSEEKHFLGKGNWARLTNNLYPAADTPQSPWVADKEGNISMEWFRSSFRLIEREVYAITGDNRIELPDFTSWKNGVEKLKSIIPYFPDDFDGRAVMAYLPEELKAKTQATAVWLLAREDMQEPLQRYLQVIQPDDDKAYRMIRDRIAEAALQSALQMQGKEIPKVNMILHARRASEATDRLINAKTDLVKNAENEAKWTAGKMHEALIKMGVLPTAEVNRVITSWATDARLNEEIINEILNKDYSGENELDFIGKGSWNRLRDNLGYRDHELLIPWMGQMEKGLQEEGPQAQPKKPIPPPIFHTELVSDIIETFKTVIAQPELLKNIDELKWTIWTSSWVLKEFGLDEQERFDVIDSWVDRSGVNISKARIADIIDRSNLQPAAAGNDSPRWLGKDNWDRLMKNLGADRTPERPWQYPVRFNLIGGLWKGIWQSLQREKSKAEYQARMLKAQREYEEREQKRREGREI